MKLVDDQELEESSVVANCNMSRERNLHGTNGYDRDLRFDPLEFLRGVANEHGQARWLDLCCGTGKALNEASEICDKEELPVRIVGVDLVGMFDASQSHRLKLIQASLSQWDPNERFDLITCVHGLHYIGNKLKLIVRAASWLTPRGNFTANLDKDNLRLDQKSSTKIIACLLYTSPSPRDRQKSRMPSSA